MSIMYKELGHIGIFCKDFDRMHDFYTNKLGCREAFRLYKPDASLWLAYIHVGNSQYIELFPDGYRKDNTFGNRSHTHFCLEVANFQQALETLRKRGVTVYEGPEGRELKVPGPDKEEGMCGSLCAFIRDPEGNWIEVMQFTPRSMQILCD